MSHDDEEELRFCVSLQRYRLAKSRLRRGYPQKPKSHPLLLSCKLEESVPDIRHGEIQGREVRSAERSSGTFTDDGRMEVITGNPLSSSARNYKTSCGTFRTYERLSVQAVR